MRPITRFFIYSILLFALFALLLRPYNWFCQSTGMCQKIYVTDFIPVSEGTEIINLVFETKNQREDLDFTLEGYDIATTVAERKNIVKYKVKNLSKNTIYFRPKFYVKPKEYEQYINRDECLCFDEHEINAGEEVELEMSFSIDLDIEKDVYFQGLEEFSHDNPRDIVIGYFAH